MSILSVISDNSLAVYAVCIPGFLISAGYVAWKSGLAGGASAGRPATPPPSSRATPRRPLAAPTKPKSLEAGQAEHQARGEAKTVKVAPVGGVPAPVPVRDERKIDTARLPVSSPSADDDSAKDDLFSGLSQAKADDALNQRKAERLEELGFHAQAKVIPSLSPEEAAAKGHTELRDAANAKPGDPKRAETRTGEETAVATPAQTPAPAANRTQTQELDDILSRIDKVLAENPVMATTTLGSASSETGTVIRPATEVVEKKKPETGGDSQQKLF